jgi:acetyltransferase-like isoleucine patch superfamily enzyme
LSACDIGRYTYFAAHSQISNCKIGALCSIGPEIRIGLGRHPARDYVSTYPSFYSPRTSGRITFGVSTDFQEYLPIEIGNDVLLSSHCIILDGVKIGDGVIIGAGAVVTRDVADYTVVAGSPARVVRQRFTDEEIAFLRELKWWERDTEWIAKHAPLFRDIRLLMQTVSK